MASIFETAPAPPCPAPFNMAAYVLEAGLARPDHPALELCGRDATERFTHGDIRIAVLNAAACLRDAGITPQDRVLMRIGNTLDFPVTYLAALWLGAVPVPTSAQLTTREISKIASLVTPKIIVASDGIALPEPCPCEVIPTDALRTEHGGTPPDAHMGDPERLGYIIFTSGTTQGPRGVCHAHRAIWARRMMFDAWYGLTPQDRLLHAGAFNWTYTLGTGLMDPWTMGATALIPAPDTKPHQIWDIIAGRKATIFAAAPGIYRQMLKQEDAPTTPTLRHGLSAGEKMAPAVKSAWHAQTGCDIHEALGMSECSTFISGSPDHPAHATSAGWPQPGRRVAVLDDAAKPVDHDTPGHLAISKGDLGLCLGYLDADLPAGEWFVTGDTVSMSADGAITYLGRGDDMMNAGGFRVSPVEVEAAFAGFPGLTEAAAITLSPKRDVEVIALVYAAPHPLNENHLRTHAEALLARYKQPRLYIHRPVLPKGGNGKLSRKALRAELDNRHRD